jgi:hypothetical protein
MRREEYKEIDRSKYHNGQEPYESKGEYQEEQQPHFTGERHEERWEKDGTIKKEYPKGRKFDQIMDNPKFVQKRKADYPNRYVGELAPKKEIEQIRPGNYKDDRYK